MVLKRQTKLLVKVLQMRLSREIDNKSELSSATSTYIPKDNNQMLNKHIISWCFKTTETRRFEVVDSVAENKTNKKQL